MEFPRALFWAICSSLYIFHLSAKIFEAMEYISMDHADDTQLYLRIKSDDKSQITKLETWLHAVKKWMSENFLLLNLEKKLRCWSLLLPDRDTMLIR